MTDISIDLVWDESAVPLLESGFTHGEVLYYYKKDLPGFVWNTAALEGNTFTLPEVQTLMDGVTVGGHPVSEAHQVEDIAKAHAMLLNLVRQSAFQVTKAIMDEFNATITARELINPGAFRGTGTVRGDGSHVNLGDRGIYTAPAPGTGGDALLALFTTEQQLLREIERPDIRALAAFAIGTLHQYYYDGNKRTARMMMNGILMSNGYNAISIPVARKLEFNEALIDLFTTKNATQLMIFLATLQ